MKRQSTRRNVFSAFVLFALVVCTIALATPITARADTAGNEFSTQSVSKKVTEDLYWAGETLDLTDNTIGQDVIAAGQDISLSDSSIGGSLRTASRSASLAGAKIKGNVTSAAQYFAADKKTDANGIYVVAQDIKFSGHAKAAALAGNTVTINGTIDGNVEVYASKLILGKNAKVTGTINGTVESQPQQAKGAKVHDIKVTVDSNKDQNALGNIVSTVVDALFSALTTAAAAVVLALLLPRVINGLAEMLNKRPVALVASGTIGTIASIPVSLMLFVSIAGMALAGGLLGILVAVCCIAVPLVGASVGVIAFPKMQRLGAAAAGGAIVGFAGSLPVLSMFVALVCMILTVGYLIQAMWVNIKSQMPQPQMPQLPQQ